MNKKIIAIIITAVICLALTAGGIIIVKTNRDSYDNAPNETNTTNETIIASSTGSDNIIFETDIFSENTANASENNNDENDRIVTVQTSETTNNNIYVEEDSIISGGNFSWR